MTLFIVSALVALLGSAFCTVQVNAYIKEYESRIRRAVERLERAHNDEEKPPEATVTDSGGALSALPPGLGYGLSPDVMHTWFDRVADLASNFPAVVLTLVAFNEVEPFKSKPLFVGLLGLGLVVVSLVALYRTGPTRSAPKGLRIRFGAGFKVTLSYWTLLLVLLNVVGVGLFIFVHQE